MAKTFANIVCHIDKHVFDTDEFDSQSVLVTCNECGKKYVILIAEYYEEEDDDEQQH